MTIEPELCLAPWLDPPRRFDRNVAIPWAESINPKSLPDPPLRLGRNWLSQVVLLIINISIHTDLTIGECKMACSSRQGNSVFHASVGILLYHRSGKWDARWNSKSRGSPKD